MKVSGKTQVCAVIGDPIEHTLSPVMHNAAFDHLKLDFIFLAFRVKTSMLENAVRGVRGLGFRGLSVTMPHKQAVTRYLDEADEMVKFLGAANTVLNKNGKLVGFNTDGVGALKALTENGLSLTGKKLLLLGAGGAAKAIAFSLTKEVKELAILNRNSRKAAELAEALNHAYGKKVVGDSLSPALIRKNLQDADILINATSVGMAPKVNQSLVEPEWLKPGLIVMDIIYNPIETKLVKHAKAADARVISGVEMLLYQGAASFEIWTGRPAPVNVMRKAILNKLSAAGAEG
jgi:shikimate dehydrogenase